MTEELFVKITLAVISIISAIVSAYVVPYLKHKIEETKGNFSAEQLATFERYVEMAVRCAEQIFTSEEWKDKKEYVMNYSKEIINDLVKINLTDEQIDTIVEGIVNEVKKGDKS